MNQKDTKINRVLTFQVFLVGCVLCLLGRAYALDVTLAWDHSKDAKGYMLYYKSGSSGPPYNGTGAAEGDSPIDVGYLSDYAIRALSDDEVYYFAVTAYSDLGESGYSNEATTARSVSGGSNSATAIGVDAGGGGCFVSTSGEGILE
jgi:hypothetical protein